MIGVVNYPTMTSNSTRMISITSNIGTQIISTRVAYFGFYFPSVFVRCFGVLYTI